MGEVGRKHHVNPGRFYLYTLNLTNDSAVRTLAREGTAWCRFPQCQKFLTEHGDKVTILALHDEFKEVRVAKRYETHGNLRHLCKFPDGYVVELTTRSDEKSITRVPFPDEEWQVRIWTTSRSAGIYLHARVSEAPKKPES